MSLYCEARNFADVDLARGVPRIISHRCRRRAPSLTTVDRFVLGLTTLFVRPRRVAKLAAILKPETLLRFHKALVDRKYRRLFSSAGAQRKSRPTGQAAEIMAAILEMKVRNPRFGHQRVAEQNSHAFAVQIDKDVVPRVFATHYGPDHPNGSDPSWLTFFAQAKDSLWNVDLFRCESILLRGQWVLMVMDVFTRRIIGFGIGGEYIDGPAVCRMLNHAIVGHAPPVRVSTDHDPVFRFQRRLANPRILEVEEIKSVPLSGPHVLLEFDRSTPKARQIPNLLQQSSRAPLPRRSHANESCREFFITEGKPGSLCLGTPLQRLFETPVAA